MSRWRRWPLPAALVALVVVAGCTVRVRPDADPVTATTAPSPASAAPAAVVHGTTLATRAFVVEHYPAVPAGSVRPGPADALPVTMRRSGHEVDVDTGSSSVVLVFPLLRGPSRCLRNVVLWLRLLSHDHEQANLAAYPSWLLSLARGRVPAERPEETLIDNRPRGIGLLTADAAWMQFDITELYRTWADGGPFPSQLRTVAKGTPLTVDVRAEDLGEPAFVARVGPIGRDRGSAPQLRWTRSRDC